MEAVSHESIDTVSPANTEAIKGALETVDAAAHGIEMGFDPSALTILVPIIAVPLLLYLVFKFRKNIGDFLDNVVNRELNRLFAHSKVRPLYSVFYKYNHVSTQAWVDWVLEQDKKIQRKVATQLADYLPGASIKQEYVILEVVRALSLLERKESFEVLKAFLQSSKAQWGAYKTQGESCEISLLGILDIDEAEAVNFIVEELNAVEEESNLEFKEYLLDSLAEIEDSKKAFKIIHNLVLSPDLEPEIKVYSLQVIKSKDSALKYPFLYELLVLLSSKHEENNDEVLKACVVELLGINAQTNKELFVKFWEKLYDMIWDDNFAKAIIEVLPEKIKEQNTSYHLISMYKIYFALKEEQRTILRSALQERNKISEQEQELFNELNKIEEIEIPDFGEEKCFGLVEAEPDLSMTTAMENLAKEFKLQIEDPAYKSKIKLILGSAKEEKLLINRYLMLESETPLLLIDANKLMHKAEEIEALKTKIIEAQAIKEIFVTNSSDFVEALLDKNHADASLAQALMNALLGLLEKDIKHLLLDINLDELGSNFENDKNCVLVFNAAELSEDTKQEIFEQYAGLIPAQRKNMLKGFMDILEYTNDFSLMQFTKYLLSYFTSSLLVTAKLIAIADFDKLFEQVRADAEIKRVQLLALEEETSEEAQEESEAEAEQEESEQEAEVATTAQA